MLCILVFFNKVLLCCVNLRALLLRCPHSYGDIGCSSRRVVGIAGERPRRHVVDAMWRGTAARSVSTKIGRTIITSVDSKLRPPAKTIPKEEVLSPRALLRIPTPLVPLSPE